uniref:lysine--tRNA ligase n=1 Tax=viral metagenome TaxID=1070528 RepID=A0A6C0CA43_9ZZZZ
MNPISPEDYIKRELNVLFTSKITSKSSITKFRNQIFNDSSITGNPLHNVDKKILNRIIKKEITNAGITINTNDTPVQTEAEYYKSRERHLEILVNNNMNPENLQLNAVKLSEIKDIKTICETCKKGESSVEVINVAGRIEKIRSPSSKMMFVDIFDEKDKIQILLSQDTFVSNIKWNIITDVLRRGDYVKVKGHPMRTNPKKKDDAPGELSVAVIDLDVIAICYHNIPFSGKMINMEIIRKQRYLSLMTDKKLMNTMLLRSFVVQEIRKFFISDTMDFIEVTTPTLVSNPGGATARPFETYANELGINLHLRIAPELYLKQLIIGGFRRVFEIGQNFRNEGIDATHNPEFTAIEAYAICTDYHYWMDLTEKLLHNLVIKVFGSENITFKTNTVSFSLPFARMHIVEELEKRLNLKFPDDALMGSNETFLQALCEKNRCLPVPPYTSSRLFDALIGLLENTIVNPTFLVGHPAFMSPLAKKKPGSFLSERFELFICGKELCNSYTEQSDPKIQLESFKMQQNNLIAGDLETPPPDKDFCVALEYGLPVTGGWGMGIDRLIMFLSNSSHIKDVILFPTVQ